MLSSWTSCVPAVDIDGYRVGDPFIAFACQQRRSGTTKQALHAYDAAFKRFNDTAHSQKLHEEMRKSYVGFSECTSIDMTVATKLKMQRAYSAGLSVYQWHPQTFLLPADYAQFERTYKARPRARWLLKAPEHNRGEGVQMLHSLDDISSPVPAIVVQRYVEPPMLVEGYKFHYRYYALLSNPPRSDGKGLALLVFPRAPLRFSTAPYAVDAEGWGQRPPVDTSRWPGRSKDSAPSACL